MLAESALRAGGERQKQIGELRVAVLLHPPRHGVAPRVYAGMTRKNRRLTRGDKTAA
jgi:hypothetical protein